MPFETAIAQAQVAGYETPLLALALSRGKLPASLEALDKGAGGAIGRLFSSGDFTGKKDEAAILYPSGPECSEAPIILHFVGSGASAKVVSVASACITETGP